MRLQDFDYTLPQELIAQSPAPDRDRSRMMVVEKRTGSLWNHVFQEFPGFLRKGDVLVINDSKVIPARLFARKTTGATVEILLLRSREGSIVAPLGGAPEAGKAHQGGDDAGF